MKKWLGEVRELAEALSRLTRRPMRRWWRHVGIWFVLVAILLIAAKLYLDAQHVAGQGSAVGTTVWRQSWGLYFILPQAIIAVSTVLTMLLWFLAALNFKLQVKEALKDQPLQAPVQMGQAMLLLFMREGVVPIILLLVASLPGKAYWFWFQILTPDSTNVALYLEESGKSFLTVISSMLFTMSLLYATRARQWGLALTWMFCLTIAPAAIRFVEALYDLDSRFRTLHTFAAPGILPDLEWQSTWILGILLTLWMLRTINGRHHKWALSALAILSVGALLGAWSRDEAPLPIAKKGDRATRMVESSADLAIAANFLRSLGSTPRRLPLLQEAYLLTDGEHRQLYLEIPIRYRFTDFRYPMNTPLLLNALWVIALGIVVVTGVPLLTVKSQYYPYAH